MPTNIVHQLLKLKIINKDEATKFSSIARNAKLSFNEDLLTPHYTAAEILQLYEDLGRIWAKLSPKCSKKTTDPTFLGTVGADKDAQMQLLEQQLGFQLAKEELPKDALFIARNYIMQHMNLFKGRSEFSAELRVKGDVGAAFIERALLILAMINRYNIVHVDACQQNGDECFATFSTLVHNDYFSKGLKLLFLATPNDVQNPNMPAVVERMCDTYFRLPIADLYWQPEVGKPVFTHFATYNGASANNIALIPGTEAIHEAFKAVIMAIKPKIYSWVEGWNSNLYSVTSKPSSPRASPSLNTRRLPDVETGKPLLRRFETDTSTDTGSPNTPAPTVASTAKTTASKRDMRNAFT